eukprot:jgi/Chlat1/6256/Chrsp44S05772
MLTLTTKSDEGIWCEMSPWLTWQPTGPHEDVDKLIAEAERRIRDSEFALAWHQAEEDDQSVLDAEETPGSSRTDSPVSFSRSTSADLRTLPHSGVDAGSIIAGGPAAHDIAAAEEAYRKAKHALEQQDLDSAASHLYTALAACPPHKARAIAKVKRLLAFTETLVAEVQSHSLARDSTSCPGFNSSYEQGVATLVAGRPADALPHLRAAAMACPPGNAAAVARVQRLVDIVKAQLQASNAKAANDSKPGWG